MGWMKTGQTMNHFDQRFPLHLDIGPVLLLTHSTDAEVMQAFPQAERAGTVRSDLVPSETIVLNAWWLHLR